MYLGKMNYAWLKKEIAIPSFAKITTLLGMIIVPNLVFLSLAFYTETSRPLINMDYLVALFVLILPWRITRILGSIIFVLSMTVDILMFVIQIFPFMDLAAIRYLSQFIFTAPNNYLVIMSALLLTIFILFFITFYLTRSRLIDRIFSLFSLVSIYIICFVFMTLDFTYARFYGILGRDNYYIAHTQTALYKEVTKSNFWNDANITPRLLPLFEEQKRAESNLNLPYSKKILYILAESWGEFRNEDAQQMIIQNILDQKDLFESLSFGSIYTTGSTVSGELRELCGLRLANNGFALSRTGKKVFSDCLPEQLRQKNYRTIALHNTSGLLYDRVDWYKKAGFQTTLFGENFLNLRRCTPFKGICDSELLGVIAKTFSDSSKEKIFFYWMTLTSHQPYAKQDILNKRFNCEKFNMNPTGDACHNAQLNTQFFDDLMQLIQKPEMSGVEVMVVGDHQPPIWGEDIKHIRPLTVSYIHFQVKENIND